MKKSLYFLVFLSITQNFIFAQSDSTIVNEMVDAGTYFNDSIMMKPAAQNAYNSGVTSFESGNYIEALEFFTNAISMEPDFDKAYFNRGCAYLNNKNYKQAIKDFTDRKSVV